MILLRVLQRLWPPSCLPRLRTVISYELPACCREVSGHVGESLVEGGEPGCGDALGGQCDDGMARGCKFRFQGAGARGEVVAGAAAVAGIGLLADEAVASHPRQGFGHG